MHMYINKICLLLARTIPAHMCCQRNIPQQSLQELKCHNAREHLASMLRRNAVCETYIRCVFKK